MRSTAAVSFSGRGCRRKWIPRSFGAACAAREVKLLPGAVFSRTGRKKNYVRLSFAGCPPERMREGVQRIDREISLLLAKEAP